MRASRQQFDLKWGAWILVLLIVCGSGCGPGVGDLEATEGRHPLMAKAKQYERGGDIDDAIAAYTEVLTLDPSLASAQLQVGLLYDQYREDYIRAIYHYQRYLELRPDAEKRDFIEELIRLAQLSYAATLPDQPSEAVREIGRLQQRIGDGQRELNEARRRIAKLTQQLEQTQQKLLAAEQVVVAAPPPPADPAPPAAPGPRTYTVQSGDNLSRIAYKMYKDSAQWRRIHEANRDVLPRAEDLRVGQTLVIPPAQGNP